MALLQDLLAQHLRQRNLAARTFAERSGIPYPTLLGVLNKGTVPRKAEHREILRRELGVESEAWATTIAASQRDGVEIPSDGPLTLRQLVLKHLLSQGFTEQSFAQSSGIPYPTLMGITRRGSLPRGETLARLAQALALPDSELQAAVARSREDRQHDEGDDGDDAQPSQPAPSLAQLAAEAVAREGCSIAAWAHQHRVPYLSLVRLLRQGEPPEHAGFLDALRAALGMAGDSFSASLSRSNAHPEPAHIAKHHDQPANPLQAAIQAAVQERNLTLKAFAEQVDLSPLTASRLLKGGELPGRVTTHLKLRAFLDLAQEDYDGLLARSREGALTAAPSLIPAGAKPAPAKPAEPTAEELAARIRSLDPVQRKAVIEFIDGFR